MNYNVKVQYSVFSLFVDVYIFYATSHVAKVRSAVLIKSLLITYIWSQRFTHPLYSNTQKFWHGD